MAADSRLTLTIPRTQPGGQAQTLSLTTSDSAKKLFVAPNNVGIDTWVPKPFDASSAIDRARSL